MSIRNIFILFLLIVISSCFGVKPFLVEENEFGKVKVKQEQGPGYPYYFVEQFDNEGRRVYSLFFNCSVNDFYRIYKTSNIKKVNGTYIFDSYIGVTDTANSNFYCFNMLIKDAQAINFIGLSAFEKNLFKKISEHMINISDCDNYKADKLIGFVKRGY